MRKNLLFFSATTSYPAKSSYGVSTLYPHRSNAPVTRATPTAPTWRDDNFMLDGFRFVLDTFHYESNNNDNTDGDADGIGDGG
jgi:hypothetical protein